ncbi:MAG TPA: hypothetical protein DEB39_06260 [Planctomycetaceae bacterium]|nr:hypothetical protein [Planctomycetaceae bacterium]
MNHLIFCAVVVLVSVVAILATIRMFLSFQKKEMARMFALLEQLEKRIHDPDRRLTQGPHSVPAVSRSESAEMREIAQTGREIRSSGPEEKSLSPDELRKWKELSDDLHRASAAKEKRRRSHNTIALEELNAVLAGTAVSTHAPQFESNRHPDEEPVESPGSANTISLDELSSLPNAIQSSKSSDTNDNR